MVLKLFENMLFLSKLRLAFKLSSKETLCRFPEVQTLLILEIIFTLLFLRVGTGFPDVVPLDLTLKMPQHFITQQLFRFCFYFLTF